MFQNELYNAVECVLRLQNRAAYIKQYVRDRLIAHKEFIQKYGEDMPEIRNWKWKGQEEAR